MLFKILTVYLEEKEVSYQFWELLLSNSENPNTLSSEVKRVKIAV